MFRPLPKHLKADQNEICNRLDPKKDVDCMTDLSNAGVFEGRSDLGFAPCTPAACMEILDYYGIDCKGKNAVVIGRSLVVGKPAAMMLMGKNATVTVCHTKTVNTAEVCRKADILVSAAGVLNSLTKDYVRPGQVVIDVSINWDEKVKPNARGGGRHCGRCGLCRGRADRRGHHPRPRRCGQRHDVRPDQSCHRSCRTYAVSSDSSNLPPDHFSGGSV